MQHVSWIDLEVNCIIKKWIKNVGIALGFTLRRLVKDSCADLCSQKTCFRLLQQSLTFHRFVF